MNKQEYMYNLFEALRPFDEEIRDEIISDYEEHFAMGLQSGKTEEQIVEELGSIDELIDDLIELKSGKRSEEKSDFSGFFKYGAKDFSKGADEFAKGVARFFGSFAGTVMNGSEKMGESVANGASSFMDDFSNSFNKMAEKVMTKGEEFAESVANGYKETRWTEEREDAKGSEPEAKNAEGISKNAVVETDCGNIIIKKSEDDKIRVNYNNYGSPNQQLAYKFDCYTKGDTMFVKVFKQYGNANFFRTLISPPIDIEVFVPENFCNLNAKTASGRISCEDIKADKAELYNVSGSINVARSSFDELTADLISGSVHIDGVCADSICSKSVSGSIKVNADATDVKLVTTSGSVKLEGSNFKNIKSTSVSGSIKIEIFGGTGLDASVNSTSGSIFIGCGESQINGSRSGKYVLGDGSINVKASSVSGGVSVECK